MPSNRHSRDRAPGAEACSRRRLLRRSGAWLGAGVSLPEILRLRAEAAEDLDDLFLKLAGRRLSEPGAAGPAA